MNTLENEIKETCSFRIQESLKREAEEYADKMGIDRSDFFRMCFKKGFEELSGVSCKGDEVIISFPISKEQELRIKSLLKYQSNKVKIHQATYQAGMDVYKFLDDTKIMSLTKYGIMPVLDGIKKLIGNREAKQAIKDEVKARGKD